MDEMTQNTGASRFATYEDYKNAFDAEVRRTEQAFVRIGYMLRVAMDTEILKGSGYTNMEEFAWAEYRIDKSQASRFIRINRRFSVDGYSDRLIDKYEGYGVAKLGEMLTLSDEVIEALPRRLTREKIQEVKKEIQEEEKISDLEILMEDKAEGSILAQWMDVYYRDHPEEFKAIKEIYFGDQQYQAMQILAPGGSTVKMARISGVGKLMLTIKDKDSPAELTNVRTGEKEKYSLEDLIRTLKGICPYTADPEGAYEQRYRIPFPGRAKEEPKPEKPDRKPAPQEPKAPRQPEQKKAEKPSVAPVQQITPPADQKKEDPGKSENTEKHHEHAPAQEEIEKQMEIENYPGVVPETYITCHDGTEVTKAKGSIRDEGCRLAEEVAQWMRTGTMEYALQTERAIIRLKEIMEQLIEEHN